MYYKAKIVSIYDQTITVNFTEYNEEETVDIGNVHPRSLWEDAGIDLSKAPTCPSSNDEEDIESDRSTETEEPPLPKRSKEKCQKASPNRYGDAPIFPDHNFFHSDPLSCLPHPPPPIIPPFGKHFNNAQSSCENCNCCQNNHLSKESLSSMLVSWYMAGYHTGYYRGVHSSMSKKCSKNS